MTGNQPSSANVEAILCVYWYPFCQSPSLVNLAHELIETSVFTACIDCRYATPVDTLLQKYILSDNSSPRKPTATALHAIPKAYSLSAIMVALRLVPALPWIVREIRSAKSYFSGLIPYVSLLKSQSKSAIYICADKFSLLPCLIASRRPQLYYSLEAGPIVEEHGLLRGLLSIIERIYLKIYKPILISQSKKRASVLQPQASNPLIIPVTSRRGAVSKADYIRKSYSISESRTIVSIIGGLGEDQLTSKLLHACLSWSDRFVLFVHSGSGSYHPNVINLSIAHPHKIILSTDSFSIDQAEDLLYAGSDIGVVLYDDLGFNYRNTAFSSGKLASYLRAGIPLLLPPFEEYSELLNEFKLGLQVRDLRSSESLLQVLLDEYSFFSAQARDAFQKIYHYNNYRGIVTSSLEAMRTSKVNAKNTIY